MALFGHTNDVFLIKSCSNPTCWVGRCPRRLTSANKRIRRSFIRDVYWDCGIFGLHASDQDNFLLTHCPQINGTACRKAVDRRQNSRAVDAEMAVKVLNRPRLSEMFNAKRHHAVARH